MNYLQMNSLEWDFRNQAITKCLNDPEKEFIKYTTLIKDNLIYIEKNEKINMSDILKHLKTFWDEAIKEEYINMRINMQRFNSFRNSI